MWKPREIIINEQVKDDPATKQILKKCQRVPVKYVDSGKSEDIKSASGVLTGEESTMLEMINAGKGVLYIASAGTAVDRFTMPDDRFLCPHFHRLKITSNGCFYQCDWCYLKGTYRANQNYITVRVGYDKMLDQAKRALKKARQPVMFNTGEMGDSLALEPMTGAMRYFIPKFGKMENGYLFALTKSANVDGILDLPHNGHTVIAWSINNETVSRKFEIGAPPFERRLGAARKVQHAGYPLRIRLDPIVPVPCWKKEYAGTIKQIFSKVTPERITLGTLRFEPSFYRMRNSILTTGPELIGHLEHMRPMFQPKTFAGRNKPSMGKFSFPMNRRVEMFRFIIKEIRKYSDCRLALCKESKPVWKRVGLAPSKIACVCQLNEARVD